MTIATLKKDDIQYIDQLQPEGWSDIVPHYTYYLHNSFCYPIKITSKKTIAGIGAGITLGKTAWLGHIIVKPEFRNKGVGTALVDHLCDYLRENGVVTILLIATDLGFPVYKKAGFTVQTEYLFFQRPQALTITQSKNLSGISKDDLEEIFCLDKKITGEARENILKNTIMNASIYKENHTITGYYVPDLGEGAIVADTCEAGIECMKLRYATAVKGVLPIDNADGIQFLKRNGFTEIYRAKRMLWGEEITWYPDKIFNRVAGNCG